MSENATVLSVDRVALNIDPEHIRALKSGLLEEVEDDPLVTRDTVQGIFHPMNRLRARIIHRAEFIALQRHLGAEMLNRKAIVELTECLEDELVGSVQGREVTTLPVQPHRRGKGFRFELSIGESIGMTQERVLAKQIITDFVGHDLPRGMWYSKDARMTQIVLASSSTAQEAELLGPLGSIIEKEVLSSSEDSFPASVRLGEVGFQLSTRVV